MPHSSQPGPVFFYLLVTFRLPRILPLRLISPGLEFNHFLFASPNPWPQNSALCVKENMRHTCKVKNQTPFSPNDAKPDTRCLGTQAFGIPDAIHLCSLVLFPA